MSNNPENYNELKNEYTREYKRVMQAIRRIKSSGIDVPESIKPESPSKVKNFTPSVIAHIRTYTPAYIRSASKAASRPTTARKQKSTTGSKRERKKAESTTTKKKTTKPKKSKSKPTKGSKVSTEKGAKPKPLSKEGFYGSNEKDFTAEPDTIAPKDSNLNSHIIERISNLLENWSPIRFRNQTHAEKKAMFRNILLEKWQELISDLEDAGELESYAYELENSATDYYEMVRKLIYDSDGQEVDEANLDYLVKVVFGHKDFDLYEDYAYYMEMASQSVIDALRSDTYG